MKAFSLANASHLPVTGESHPLVRESLRWLTTGNAVALSAVMLIFGMLYAWSEMNPNDAVDGPTKIVDPHVISPTPTPGPSRPNYGFTTPETPHKDGVFDPVPDPVSRDEVGGDDPGDIGEGDPPPVPGDGPGDGPFGGYAPAPADTFFAFDELPVLLSITAPVYPDLARQAGIDGTVMVRVLVTRAGKVKEAFAVEGPEPLWAAAVDAAKTALFKPALQGDNPVEVWVMIPVTFSINR